MNWFQDELNSKALKMIFRVMKTIQMQNNFEFFKNLKMSLICEIQFKLGKQWCQKLIHIAYSYSYKVELSLSFFCELIRFMIPAYHSFSWYASFSVHGFFQAVNSAQILKFQTRFLLFFMVCNSHIFRPLVFRPMTFFLFGLNFTILVVNIL